MMVSESLAGLNVSRETVDRLKGLQDLLVKWNPAVNLVSKRSLPETWERHILDSAQLFQMAPTAVHWADLGSGGGFPGLVIAVIATELATTMRISLVESDQRKATFLRQAAQTLGLKAEVHPIRIETLEPLAADVLSARALAPLPALCGFAERHLAPGGLCLFPKGITYAEELAAAQALWQMEVEILPSTIDASGVILAIRNVSRV